jgi:hypothetical protein
MRPQDHMQNKCHISFLQKQLQPSPYSNNTNKYNAKQQQQKEDNKNFPIKFIKASYLAVTAGSTVSITTNKLQEHAFLV